jgi:hypothetical protein
MANAAAAATISLRIMIRLRSFTLEEAPKDTKEGERTMRAKSADFAVRRISWTFAVTTAAENHDVRRSF